MGPLFWLRAGIYTLRGYNYVRERKFRFILAGGITAGTATILAKNDWDVNSIGAVRFARAGLTFASIAADYKWSVYLRPLPEDQDEVKRLWSEVHTRSANKMLRLCEANRGVFIKVGQHLGSMWYLLPPEYTTTLQVLHSKAPESPLEDVYAVIREDLKAEPEEVFAEFDPKILGAASLAQVYKAKLKTGETVAVKVQHRQVKAHCFVDMTTMDLLVKMAAKLFPDFKFWWLADATKKNIPMELDFLNEGRNAELVSSTLSDLDWLKIPKIYWKYSTERVLTMEFLEGGFVNDLEYMKSQGISAAEVADKLGTMYSKMIFTHGLVHSDPHPGNVMVWKNDKGKLQLGLLDHGLYANLPHEFRYSYAQLWLSIINQDAEGMEKYSKELGVGDYYRIFPCIVTARSWNQLTDKTLGGVTALKTSAEASFLKRRMAELLPEITEVFERIPRAMVLVMKTNDLLRGVECSLNIHSTLASFVSLTRHCVQAVYTEKLRLSESTLTSVKLHLLWKWELFRISFFELYVWFATKLSPRRQIEAQHELM